MHPFDLKNALLARHAQHVVIIHFPIALLVIGVVFDYAGRLLRNEALRSAAYYNFLAAALSVPFAVATGLLAWQLQLEGQRLHGILLLHLLLGLGSSVLICFVWWINRAAPLRSAPDRFRLAVEAIAVVVVGLTGHLGGFLSGINT